MDAESAAAAAWSGSKRSNQDKDSHVCGLIQLTRGALSPNRHTRLQAPAMPHVAFPHCLGLAAIEAR